MKRVIAGLLAGVFCCSLFSGPVYALRNDPNLPSQTPFEYPGAISNGDDSHWGDPNESPNPGGDGCWLINVLEGFLDLNPGCCIIWKTTRIKTVKLKLDTGLKHEKPNRHRVILPSGEAAAE